MYSFYANLKGKKWELCLDKDLTILLIECHEYSYHDTNRAAGGRQPSVVLSIIVVHESNIMYLPI